MLSDFYPVMNRAGHDPQDKRAESCRDQDRDRPFCSRVAETSVLQDEYPWSVWKTARKGNDRTITRMENPINTALPDIKHFLWRIGPMHNQLLVFIAWSILALFVAWSVARALIIHFFL